MDLASDCRYKDCTHIHEQGCAVIEAVEDGEIDREAYDNYLKMEKEKLCHQIPIIAGMTICYFSGVK